MINIANALPQSLAPAISLFFLSIGTRTPTTTRSCAGPPERSPCWARWSSSRSSGSGSARRDTRPPRGREARCQQHRASRPSPGHVGSVSRAVSRNTLLRSPCRPLTAVVDGDVTRALGIPYARAERFAAPEPVPATTEPYPATTPAPVAPQRSSPAVDQLLPPMDLQVDEHCQRLSVTVPSDDRPDERLPVMVWIHGGSYVIGGGDLPIHDPRTW